MKGAKYFLSYLVPFSAFMAITFGGIHSFATLIIAFVMFPLLELFLTGTSKNLTKEEESTYKNNPFFDWLVYVNVPAQYGVLLYFLYTVSTKELPTFDLIGMICSVGVCCGVLGINVAHELGHRRSKTERFLAKALLLTTLYMHFIIEHNRGHHKNVSTDLDPASAKLNEPVYLFWFRSIFGSYKHAWVLENERLAKTGASAVSWKNEMIWFQIIQLLFVAAIFFVFGLKAMLCFFAVSLGGYLLLETVNYIEHYGLRRKETAPGRYEKCMPWHSWNSNHTLGRIFLYDLTRHSDHHYLASRKYQILRHFEEAPQLPMGYPGAVLLSLIPPLWFKIINPRVKALSEEGKRHVGSKHFRLSV